MNIENKKYLYNLQRCLDSIKGKDFDEYMIKEFLILLRDDLPKKSILSEICNFIAHPTRDSGITHERTNHWYWQTKWQMSGMKDGKVVLQKFPWEKMSKIEFDQLIKGIKYSNDEVIEIQFNLDKNRLIQSIKNMYKLRNNYFELIPKPKNIKLIQKIDLLIIRTVRASYLLVDDTIIDDIKTAVEMICARHNMTASFKEAEIDDSKNDMVLCILSIMQNCKFMLYDGTYANSRVTVRPEDSNNKASKKLLALDVNFRQEHVNIFVSMPMIGTKIEPIEYFNPVPDTSKDIFPFVTERKDGNLVIKLI